MSCLMLLASLPPVRVGTGGRVLVLLLSTPALHAAVVRRQQPAHPFGRTPLGRGGGFVDTTGDQLRHRCALGQAGARGLEVFRWGGGRGGSRRPALVGSCLPAGRVRSWHGV